MRTNAFPCQFPFGNGDLTDKIRSIHISLNDACNHYLKYGKLDVYDIMINPFPSKMKSCHHIQDMDERNRIKSKASIHSQKLVYTLRYKFDNWSITRNSTWL